MEERRILHHKDNAPASNLFDIHYSFVRDMLQQYNMPEFLKCKFIAMRKQVQIALLGNCISAWEKLAFEKFGSPYLFSMNRPVIMDTMRTVYIPMVEAYYGCSIPNFYMFTPHYSDQVMYGFTVKIFSKQLFKSIDPHHVPWEEKLANALSVRLRNQYGRGPGQTIVALINNRFLFFSATTLLAPFPKKFAETYPDSLDTTASMLKALMTDAVDYVCTEHYGQTFETFVEVDIASNQVIALAVIEPFTKQELIF